MREMKSEPIFSIIIPVKNEANLLKKCLESLAGLDYPRHLVEIIVADGLSVDNTKEVAASYGARVAVNEKQIVGSGRNAGFRESKGEFIAFTDADCVFDAGWLKNSLKYFQDLNVGGVGGVSLPPEDSTAFEKSVDFLFSLAGAFGTTCHRKSIDAAAETKDIPGCNAIYRREALDKVMPVDENLLTAEDAWMNFCVRKNGYKLIFAPDVILWHYRRSSPRRLFKQAYRFAIGRLQAGKKEIKLLNPYYITTGFSIPIFFTLAITFYLSGMAHLFLSLVLLSFLFLMSVCLINTKSAQAALNFPLVLTVFDAGWSAGFLRELLFPLKDSGGR